MANTLRMKRRGAGGGAGAPATLASGEPAYNEVDGRFYYGFGDNGSGVATSTPVIGGPGAPFAVPPGGGAKTFLTKQSGSDYDFVWGDPFDWLPLETITISTPLLVAETAVIPDLYTQLLLVLDGVSHNSGSNQALDIQCSFNSGSSYHSNYAKANGSDTSMWDAGTKAGAALISGVLQISDSRHLHRKFTVGMNVANPASYQNSIGHIIGAPIGSAINRFKLFPVAGSIDAGVIYVLGKR